MVYVNSQKFACESCIKGHRSSSCHHTDRPLFEIKKKGRPVSQCTKCRELRQSKKFHSKCTCNHQSEAAPAMQPLASSSGSKTRRFIPIVPALPNGLRDVLAASQSSSSSLPPDSRQRVDSLLNPCDCKSVWKCKCRSEKSPALSSTPETPQVTTKGTDALSALAHAAALQSCLPSSDVPALSSSSNVEIAAKSTTLQTRFRSPSPVYTSSKRQKHDKLYSSPTPGPDLAPILYSASLPRHRSTPIPDFPSMPPISKINSLAGSGCTCGFQCSCPGCVEHRGKTHATPERKDCAHGCGTCIDHSLGMSLPTSSASTSATPSSSQNSGTSILDQFFARAAALPPPPTYRKMSSNGIDPMDTTRYTDFSRPQGGSSFAFGSIKLPKLECCGGQCNCPAGRCTCRVSCAGCCADDKMPVVPRKEVVEIQIQKSLPVDVDQQSAPVRSCCAGKV